MNPPSSICSILFFFFQAEDGIRYYKVTGVQTCALPISAIGIAVSLAVTRFLSSMLYEVKPGDPLTLIGVLVLLLVVALVACYIPARRATRVNPLVALRHE